MERIIKFRAYNTHTNEMEYDVHLLDRFAEILSSEHYKVQQFTGHLSFFSQQEVYQGDFIKVAGRTRIQPTSAIYFHNLFLTWVVDMPATFSTYSLDTHAPIPIWQLECEVIGSIYTTPSLIKQTV
jgi:hypothetical protein